MNECDTNDPHYGLESIDEFLVKKSKTIALLLLAIQQS